MWRGKTRRRGRVVAGGLLAAVGAVLLTGCALFAPTRPPIARMVATPETGTSPLVVTFNAAGSESRTSTGEIASYFWEFGDGATGSGITTQHTYVNTSTTIRRYTATLTVTDDAFATARVQQSIEVHPSTGTDGTPGDPTAVISANRIAGPVPLTVAFDGSASDGGEGTITAYNWDFDDGRTGSGARVSHTFTPSVTTEYRVTLFVWTGGGAVSTAEITIVAIVPSDEMSYERPHAELAPLDPLLLHRSSNPASVPTLFEVAFDPRGSYAAAGQRILYYVWNFGDGSDWVIRTNDSPITHVYRLNTQSRTFVVRMFVYDDQGMEDEIVRNLTLIQPDEA